MLTPDHASARYRLYRWGLSAGIGLLTLLLILGLRVYEESRRIAATQQALVAHTAQQLDMLIWPVDRAPLGYDAFYGMECPQIQLKLLKQAADLQTLRSIVLVRDGVLICSSLVGTLNLPFSSVLPELPAHQKLLALRASVGLNRGEPLMLMWKPFGPDDNSGQIYTFNIRLLAQFLLEPQPPYADRLVLNVSGNSLEYHKNSLTPQVNLSGLPQYTHSSPHYPFSISLYARSAYHLAFAQLYHHLPLALLISLLVMAAAYLVAGTRMSLAYPLNHALDRREFAIYCQPIIHCQSARCVGIETLLRWNSPRYGPVPPDVFIPLAEQHALIVPLTRYLMAQIADNFALFPQDPAFYISINVDARHFHQRQILQDVQQIWLAKQPPVTLMIELTERSRLSDIDSKQIHQLKALGVLLAIDDFGTGHNSLSYLKGLNPDVLKIDQSFTAAIGTDAVNATVTDMIITLAQRLKLKLVVEGVETPEQIAYLRERQVDAVQGYYYARPLPVQEFPAWLARFHGATPDGAQPAQQEGKR
ncbi:EAL domain-containing protein [Chimaeribacter arupi]|uniref:EAL domain-containing protein n=1 Tax=Chimaeribacter arupi TaxID=2060066 RepID=UPI000C7C6354|nr:cyclic diguanylate phosphodiesterase [Chimaeribacter arupi]PLR40006.1 cyclic diguanylate phosphodiesterase [Chimaeribacter arupi]